MNEEIFALACGISQATEEESAVLKRLCTAAYKKAVSDLRCGVREEECEDELICAAAYIACAALESMRGGAVSSLRAGDVTIRARSAADCASSAAQLLMMAKAILQPYAKDSVAFLGVRA